MTASHSNLKELNIINRFLRCAKSVVASLLNLSVYNNMSRVSLGKVDSIGNAKFLLKSTAHND